MISDSLLNKKLNEQIDFILSYLKNNPRISGDEGEKDVIFLHDEADTKIDIILDEYLSLNNREVITFNYSTIQLF